MVHLHIINIAWERISRDFFLWGHLKEKVYATPVATIEDLEEIIRRGMQTYQIVSVRKSLG